MIVKAAASVLKTTTAAVLRRNIEGSSYHHIRNSSLLSHNSHVQPLHTSKLHATVSMSSSPSSAALSVEKLRRFKESFVSEPRNLLAQQVCATRSPLDVSHHHPAIHEANTIFNKKVEPVGKPYTYQEKTGTCWIYALCNCIRIPLMRKYQLEEFELSQTYLFFWDKIERSHFFLRNVIRATREGEKVGGRLVDFLLSQPCEDGGQWDMLVNLVNKHGLVPKSAFQGSLSGKESIHFNRVLCSKLREFAAELIKLVQDGKADPDIDAALAEMMQKVYNIVAISLGQVPEDFVFHFHDKEKKYQKVGTFSPQSFYQEIVKPLFNVDDMVCLVNDPRHDFKSALTVDYMGNVVGGRPVIYHNQEAAVLKEAVIKQITDNEAVWFGCMVSKLCSFKLGTLDPNSFNFPVVFGFDIEEKLSKKERLSFGDIAATHAMVFSAVHLGEGDKLEKLLVENSWGDDYGKKGNFVMTPEWFDTFVLEVVVHKKNLTDDVLADLAKTPQVLPPWDPMGVLAK